MLDEFYENWCACCLGRVRKYSVQELIYSHCNNSWCLSKSALHTLQSRGDLSEAESNYRKQQAVLLQWGDHILKNERQSSLDYISCCLYWQLIILINFLLFFFLKESNQSIIDWISIVSLFLQKILFNSNQANSCLIDLN